MKSKFSIWAYILVALLLLAAAIPAMIFIKTYYDQKIPPLQVFAFAGVFIFACIWLFFGELRTKAISVEISMNEIGVRQYIGLGGKRLYNISELDGFKISHLRSKYDVYEYMYLLKNGKKVVKLSEFYHSNYADFKNALVNRLQDKGLEEASLLREFKEVFI